MPEPESLQTVLSKVRVIANENYNQNVQDNILNIFADLSLPEQRTLLKGFVQICFIIEGQVLENKKTISETNKELQATKEEVICVTNDVNYIETEIKSIDAYNKLELIKLKTWFVKSLIIFIFFCLFAFTVIISFLDGIDAVPDVISNIFAILKEFVGI